MQFEGRTKRINGFSPPYSREQILSLIFYSISVFLNYLFVAFDANGSLFVEFLIISSLLNLTTITCWIFASIIDPVVVGNEQLPLLNCCPVQRSSVYCLDCDKTIYKMDHHCSFLNNCVGEKNYGWFSGLVCSGLLQMILQLIVMVLCFLTDEIEHWHEASDFQETHWLQYFLCAVQGMISFSFLLGFLCLIAFHLFLNCFVRKGTYDWLLFGRQKRLYSSAPNEERSSSLTESRLQELQRQQERERFAKQMEQARKNKHQNSNSNSHKEEGLMLQLLSTSRESEEQQQLQQNSRGLGQNQFLKPLSREISLGLSPQISILPEILDSEEDGHGAEKRGSNNSPNNKNNHYSSNNSQSHNTTTTHGHSDFFLASLGFRGAKEATVFPSDDPLELIRDRGSRDKQRDQDQDDLEQSITVNERLKLFPSHRTPLEASAAASSSVRTVDAMSSSLPLASTNP